MDPKIWNYIKKGLYGAALMLVVGGLVYSGWQSYKAVYAQGGKDFAVALHAVSDIESVSADIDQLKAYCGANDCEPVTLSRAVSLLTGLEGDAVDRLISVQGPIKDALASYLADNPGAKLAFEDRLTNTTTASAVETDTFLQTVKAWTPPAGTPATQGSN